MVRVKCVLMERFVVCVGRIFCGAQGRCICFFSDQKPDERKEVLTLVMTLWFLVRMHMLEDDFVYMVEW